MSLPEVIDYVANSRGQLDVPLTCNQELKDVMIKCWNFRPSDRPSFHEILDDVRELYRELIRVEVSPQQRNIDVRFQQKKELLNHKNNSSYT